MASQTSGLRRFSAGIPPPRKGSLYATNVQRGTDLQRGSVGSISTIPQTKGHSWWYILNAMQKQNRSLSSGFTICTCAIIINSYFFYFDIFENISDIYDGKNHYKTIDVAKIAMYYVGASIGSFSCGSYQYTWPARQTNYVISTVLFVSCIFMLWISDIAICIARTLAGFCYGFIYIALISQVADNTMKTVRGYMANGFALFALLGMIIGVAFSERSWKNFIYMIWTLRITLLGFPIIAIVLNHFFTYEPITRLLRMGQETEAREVLDVLRGGKIETTVIQYEIDERKLMLIEDYDEENEKSQFCGFQNVFKNGNAMTLLWIILLRILYVLTSNMYLYILSALYIHQDFNYIMHIALMLTRYFALLIPHYSIDKLGRRGLFLTSGLGAGILLLPFAAQHTTDINIRGDLIAIITFAMHIFAALGIESVQSIYASEAFPLSQRNASLAIVTNFEYILQGTIVLLLLTGEENTLKIFLIATPVIVLFLTIILFVKLPETKSMPLRRCRDAFNKNIPKKTLPPNVPGIHTLGSVYL